MTVLDEVEVSYYIRAVLSTTAEVFTAYPSQHKHLDYTITYEAYRQHTARVVGSVETGDQIYAFDILPLLELIVRQQNGQHDLVGAVIEYAESEKFSTKELKQIVSCLRETLSPGLLEEPKIFEPWVGSSSLQREVARDQPVRRAPRRHKDVKLFVQIDRYGILRLLQLCWRYGMKYSGDLTMVPLSEDQPDWKEITQG
jgi:hypothetical protein